MRVKVPIISVKECPACGNAQTFVANEGRQAPDGWIKLAVMGFDGYVCSEDCVTRVIQVQKENEAYLKVHRETLPPDVVI